MLVRHPETDDNAGGRYVGRGDSAYTERGLIQAEMLVAKIVEFNPSVIWSSPLPRALTVAREAGASTGAKFHIDERLNEIDYGLAQGLTYEETVARGLSFQFTNVEGPVAPGGESRRDMWERSVAAVDDMLAEHGRVAVVTHGGVFRSALPYLLGMSIDFIWRFNIRTAQIAIVRVVDGHGMLDEFITG